MKRKHCAIIPIREHSKEIRNKNIVHFVNNKTSLEMISEIIVATELFDVYVSTESKMLAAYARFLGLQILERDQELSRDDVTLDQVIAYHLQQELLKNYSYMWVVQATCPLLKKDTLLSMYDMITSDESIDTIFTATQENKFLWKTSDNDH